MSGWVSGWTIRGTEASRQSAADANPAGAARLLHIKHISDAYTSSSLTALGGPPSSETSVSTRRENKKKTEQNKTKGSHNHSRGVSGDNASQQRHDISCPEGTRSRSRRISALICIRDHTCTPPPAVRVMHLQPARTSIEITVSYSRAWQQSAGTRTCAQSPRSV